MMTSAVAMITTGREPSNRALPLTRKLRTDSTHRPSVISPPSQMPVSKNVSPSSSRSRASERQKSELTLLGMYASPSGTHEALAASQRSSPHSIMRRKSPSQKRSTLPMHSAGRPGQVSGPTSIPGASIPGTSIAASIPGASTAASIRPASTPASSPPPPSSDPSGSMIALQPNALKSANPSHHRMPPW